MACPKPWPNDPYSQTLHARCVANQRQTPLDCVKDGSFVESATTVGGIMGAVAGGLVFIGGVIGAPVTGGTSLVAGATAAGALSGVAAAGIRGTVGKPCRSPALPAIQKVTEKIPKFS